MRRSIVLAQHEAFLHVQGRSIFGRRFLSRSVVAAIALAADATEHPAPECNPRISSSYEMRPSTRRSCMCRAGPFLVGVFFFWAVLAEVAVVASRLVELVADATEHTRPKSVPEHNPRISSSSEILKCTQCIFMCECVDRLCNVCVQCTCACACA